MKMNSPRGDINLVHRSCLPPPICLPQDAASNRSAASVCSAAAQNSFSGADGFYSIVLCCKRRDLAFLLLKWDDVCEVERNVWQLKRGSVERIPKKACFCTSKRNQQVHVTKWKETWRCDLLLDCLTSCAYSFFLPPAKPALEFLGRLITPSRLNKGGQRSAHSIKITRWLAGWIFSQSVVSLDWSFCSLVYSHAGTIFSVRRLLITQQICQICGWIRVKIFEGADQEVQWCAVQISAAISKNFLSASGANFPRDQIGFANHSGLPVELKSSRDINSARPLLGSALNASEQVCSFQCLQVHLFQHWEKFMFFCFEWPIYYLHVHSIFFFKIRNHPH